MGMNEFADQTWEEFSTARLGYINRDLSVLRAANTEDVEQVEVAAGAAVDWRSKGIVTPIKDQGQCGSCWAFSTTGSTEGAYAQKTGKLVSLSEQQLVDCSTSYGNQGCNGGLMDSSFQYIIANGGITGEANYKYTGSDGTCNKSKAKQISAKITSFKDVAAGSESSLLTAVTKQPVSVAIEADQSAFQFYSSGILSSGCGKSLDHGVLVVGYGTASSTDYWIVKNSWGSSWGEAGYIRIKRGSDLCGISDQASYPVA
jgi:C1A family cysteine protease